jgi:hypothetical protein
MAGNDRVDVASSENNIIYAAKHVAKQKYRCIFAASFLRKDEKTN